MFPMMPFILESSSNLIDSNIMLRVCVCGFDGMDSLIATSFTASAPNSGVEEFSNYVRIAAARVP